MPPKLKLLNIILAGAFLFILPILCNAQDMSGVSRIKTVVIDPGHGGKDPGAISKNGKYREKDITLSVALKLGNLIKSNYPDIKVIYTRSTDKYVELIERASIANRNKADLFISIHVNATKSTQPRGTETFVMGAHKSEANFEVCKMENAVIVIEDDYETKYEGFNPNSPESYIIFSLLQNVHQSQSIKYAAAVQKEFSRGPITVNRGVKQGGLLVLWRTTMPSVLTELGFITNAKDCSILISKDGQNQMARRLFNAFVSYKKEFEGGESAPVVVNVAPEAEKVTQESESAPQKPVETGVKSSDDFYAVQILSVNKVLKSGGYDLKGRKDARYLKVGKLYKYYLGEYPTRKEALDALPSVRKSFPGAFIIHIKDNAIVK